MKVPWDLAHSVDVLQSDMGCHENTLLGRKPQGSADILRASWTFFANLWTTTMNQDCCCFVLRLCGQHFWWLRVNDFPLVLVISGHVLLHTWTSWSKTFWHSLSSMWVFWYARGVPFSACAIFCQAPEGRNKLKLNGRALSSSQGKNRWEREKEKEGQSRPCCCGRPGLAGCLSGSKDSSLPRWSLAQNAVVFSS